MSNAYDEGLDPDGPSEADLDRFGGETVTCASCGADHYDQLDTCPHCNASMNDKKPMPGLIMLVVAAVIVAFIIIVVF
jgi:uncharacterized OB-fold protein